jgi:hypothetical protein
MVINGLTQTALIAQIQAAQRSAQPKDSPTNQSANIAAERAGTAPLGNLRILSEVSAAGPGGKGGFTAIRFDLGDSADASDAAALGAPTQADKAEDDEMLSVVIQVAKNMGITPNASDITLKGTAATDLRQKVDLLV